jgi:hypothetical protein
MKSILLSVLYLLAAASCSQPLSSPPVAKTVQSAESESLVILYCRRDGFVGEVPPDPFDTSKKGDLNAFPKETFKVDRRETIIGEAWSSLFASAQKPDAIPDCGFRGVVVFESHGKLFCLMRLKYPNYIAVYRNVKKHSPEVYSVEEPAEYVNSKSIDTQYFGRF